MSICPIVLPKNVQQKNKTVFFGGGSFFGPLSLLNEFRADLHMGKKGGMTNRGEKLLQSCFLPHTPTVLFCGSKTTKTSNNSSSNSNNSSNRGGHIM